MPWACSSSMVLSPSVRFRARRSIRGTTTHGPAGGDVGVEPVIPEAVAVEDAALGGQPAFSLSLGDTDVAEDRWVHSLTPL